jgi:hypothetical protein
VIPKVVWKVLRGVISGLIYYVIFLVIIPWILGLVTRYQIELVSLEEILYYAGVFIALGVLSATLKPFIGLVFTVLSILIGSLFLITILGMGSLQLAMNISGEPVEVSLEFKELLMVIIGIGFVFAIIDIFEKLAMSEE